MTCVNSVRTWSGERSAHGGAVVRDRVLIVHPTSENAAGLVDPGNGLVDHSVS